MKYRREKIVVQCANLGTEWDFNPPYASHFGCAWERLNSTVREILYTMVKEILIILDDEAFSTLFCEVEGIMNNRPVANLSDVI